MAYAQRRPATKTLVDHGWAPGQLRAVYDLKHKYVFSSQEQDQFYDLTLDPLELHNLIGSPQLGYTKQAAGGRTLGDSI